MVTGMSAAASPNLAPTRIVLGAMTGTSCDGLDMAALRICGRGLDASSELLAAASVPLGALGDDLRRLGDQAPMTAGEIAELNHALSELHAHHLAELDAPKPDLAVIHGQTIFHRPPITWQLIEPALIARRLDCAVLSDLRSADCAAGGQGAPLTPLSDWCWFRSPQEHRVVINFGGFINATLLPANAPLEMLQAADICACNHVLDELARLLLKQPFDRDGAVALGAQVDHGIAARFGELLQQQQGQGRSLGSGDELRQSLLGMVDEAPAGVLLRSAIEAIVGVIVAQVKSWCPQGIDRFIIAGGGCKNRALVMALAEMAGLPVELSDAHGVPPLTARPWPWRDWVPWPRTASPSPCPRSPALAHRRHPRLAAGPSPMAPTKDSAVSA